MILEEDRQPRDTSSVAQITNKAHTYDTYMCPEPYEEFPISGKGVDHSQLITDCLITSQSQYQSRKQLRVAAELSLECAREMVNTQSWDRALALLRPLWENKTFRSESWVDISEDLCWLLRRAAAAGGRADLVVAIDWELMHRSE